MRGWIPSGGFLPGILFAILTGRRATGGYEPRQVREEAAISKSACVADRFRSYMWRMYFRKNSIGGAQPIFWSVKIDHGPWSKPAHRYPYVLNLLELLIKNVFPNHAYQKCGLMPKSPFAPWHCLRQSYFLQNFVTYFKKNQGTTSTDGWKTAS